MPALPDTILDLRNAIATRAISCEEATRATLAGIEQLNPALNAVLETLAEPALDRARALDHRPPAAEGTTAPTGALTGVPILIKDNICTGPDILATTNGAAPAPSKTTCASRLLADYRSPYSATAVQRLASEGAIIIGKTNLDEFAMGSSGEHSAFGVTRNPWDPARVPGGSSSGSAAAVASGMVTAALGSDTGGSVRQPAAFCGLVGVKPTYGRISRYGLVAYASSLDQIGTLTRTVADAALLLKVIAGHDPRDMTSSSAPLPDNFDHVDDPLTSPLIGIPTQARSEGNDPAVTAALDAAAETYRSLGATIVDVDLAHTDQAIAAYYIIATAEASSNLARFDGIRYGRRASLSPAESLEDLYARSRAEGFGEEVRRRIMLGTYVLSAGYYDAYYTTAMKSRRLIKSDYDRAFGADLGSRLQGGGADLKGLACDAILMPTAPTPAYRLGEKLDDPLAMYLGDVYTVGVNLAGLPAVSFPAGLAAVDGKQLPIGMQLVGRAFDEHRLLRLARMFETATDWHKRRPPIHPPIAS